LGSGLVRLLGSLGFDLGSGLIRSLGSGLVRFWFVWFGFGSFGSVRLFVVPAFRSTSRAY
jgi:hypothetical protein